MTRNVTRQSGNVLFLILIAVALFAALSYVVLSSSRSGGASTEKERLELDVASTLNTLTNIRAEIVRRSIQGGSYQLTTNPGGLYADDGLPRIFPPLTLKSDIPAAGTDNEFVWFVSDADVRVAVVYTGSAERDIFILNCGYNISACRLINRRLIGTENIPTFTPFGGGGSGWFETGVRRDFTNYTVNNPTRRINIAESMRGGGCMRPVTVADLYCLYFPVLER